MSTDTIEATADRAAVLDDWLAEQGLDLPRPTRAWLIEGDRAAVLYRGGTLAEAVATEKPEWAEAIEHDQHGVRATSPEGRFRYCPPGRYVMGSPPDEPGRFSDEDQREVTVAGFWMATVPEVAHDDLPLVYIDWHKATAYAEERGCRLPTEEEWEYACRADTTGPTYASEGQTLDDIAVYGASELAPVATKAPNPWGLYDMLGNVWEWTSSPWRRSDPTEAGSSVEARGSTPRAACERSSNSRRESVCQSSASASADEGAFRLIRGSLWFNSARDIRAAFRLGFLPSYRLGALGFRLCRG